MKLTHEGAARLGRHEAQGFPVCDFEFQPEDFKGGCCQNGKDHVTLSVDEAKEIAFKLKELSEGYFLETGNIDSRSVEWSIVLNERIEQAEKDDE